MAELGDPRNFHLVDDRRLLPTDLWRPSRFDDYGKNDCLKCHTGWY